jgi:anthranilate synthase component 1
MKTIPYTKNVAELVEELGKPCLLPITLTVDGCADPTKVYLGMRSRGRPSYLLESAEGAGKLARYSFIGADPLLTLRIKDEELEIRGHEQMRKIAEKRVEKAGAYIDTIEAVRKAFLLDLISIPAVDYPRFICGPVGYFSYDVARRIADIGREAVDDLQHPDAEFMLAKNIVVFDHAKKKTFVGSNAFISEISDLKKECANSIKNIETNLKRLGKIKRLPRLQTDAKLRADITSNMTRNEYIAAVKRVQEYIDSGDVLQLVLARRMKTKLKCDPYLAYLALRRINPSPYMYYLDFRQRKIIGSSPETLVRVENGEVMTRPIGGTRRRGKDAKEDKEIERKLLSDRKEREEHMMLVHLGREDISKIAKVGSVKVKDFMTIERYSDVMHIVSTVVGKLREDKNEFDALRANFPAGTVVGAPRLRAMEIIEELEPTRRGIYAGGVGYFDYRHNMDFAIAIRTIVTEKDVAYVQAGAGIVARSVPELEFYETENKGRALIRAIEMAKASGRR